MNMSSTSLYIGEMKNLPKRDNYTYSKMLKIQKSDHAQ